MDLSLLVLKGKPQGKELPIRDSPFIIGRGPECHLRPNSDMVSRLHCALTIRGEEVSIRDLGSTNGTIVVGTRLTEEFMLTDGDIFQVGPLAFQVVIRAGSATAHPTSAPTTTPAAAAAAGREAVAKETAKADDVVQWLIGDSKNEIPASGSGVYAGDTVFTADMRDKDTASDAVHSGMPPDSAQPAAKAGKSDDQGPKAAEKKQKTVEATGAAAHAAEDLIHRFLERRHK